MSEQESATALREREIREMAERWMDRYVDDDSVATCGTSNLVEKLAAYCASRERAAEEATRHEFLALCDRHPHKLADVLAGLVRMTPPYDSGALSRVVQQAVEAERERCAKVVAAEGCICVGKLGPVVVENHLRICPQRIAYNIRALPATVSRGTAEKCGAPAASLIPRWGMSFACVLPKGHEGEHRQGGTCFKHGEYVGDKCPQWPRCIPNAISNPAEPTEIHKPGQIQVNGPMCDKCGKMFLECQCGNAASNPAGPLVPNTVPALRFALWYMRENGSGAAVNAASEDAREELESIELAREREGKLRTALEQWKCPACGGSREFTGYSKEAPGGQTCRKCADTNGLHPVAFAALESK